MVALKYPERLIELQVTQPEKYQINITVSNEYRMADNETISCEEDNDCLFVAGNEFFRVWHVILIAAAIIILIRK